MKNLISTKEAAEFLGVSPEFLERARWAGKPEIPFVRVGERAVRYDPEALKEYAISRTYRSTSEAGRAAA